MHQDKDDSDDGADPEPVDKTALLKAVLTHLKPQESVSQVSSPVVSVSYIYLFSAIISLISHIGGVFFVAFFLFLFLFFVNFILVTL